MVTDGDDTVFTGPYLKEGEPLMDKLQELLAAYWLTYGQSNGRQGWQLIQNIPSQGSSTEPVKFSTGCSSASAP